MTGEKIKYPYRYKNWRSFFSICLFLLSLGTSFFILLSGLCNIRKPNNILIIFAFFLLISLLGNVITGTLCLYEFWMLKLRIFYAFLLIIMFLSCLCNIGYFIFEWKQNQFDIGLKILFTLFSILIIGVSIPCNIYFFNKQNWDIDDQSPVNYQTKSLKEKLKAINWRQKISWILIGMGIIAFITSLVIVIYFDKRDSTKTQWIGGSTAFIIGFLLMWSGGLLENSRIKQRKNDAIDDEQNAKDESRSLHKSKNIDKSIIGINITKKLLHKDEMIINEFYIIDKYNNLIGLTELGRKQEKLILPSTINSIAFDFRYRAHGVFEKNKILKEIVIPNNIKYIDKWAFKWCENLEKIVFEPNSQVDYIGYETFRNCHALREINLPESLKEIDEYAFSSSAIEKVNITKSVKKIGKNAFDGCKALKEIKLPNSLVEIGKAIFSNCWNLTKVEFEPNSKLNEIPEYTFWSCTALRQITIPENIIKINDNAFAWCINLQKVTLDNESVLDEIGAKAFEQCKALKEINLPKNVKVDESAFNGCDLLNEK